jgi:hypothetical protein
VLRYVGRPVAPFGGERRALRLVIYLRLVPHEAPGPGIDDSA